MFRWSILLIGGWTAATISGAAGFGGAVLLLPLLTYFAGAKAAVPILTLAQLLGNLARAGFGWREIRWRLALLFSVGAVPASIVGSRLFIDLPPTLILRVLGIFLLLIVILRHTSFGQRPINESLLAPAGLIVGFVSAIAGSAGPLGAAVFLGLRLPPKSYVASEAVTAVFMHLTKSFIYGRYSLLTRADLLSGLSLGGAMIVGAWSGRRIIEWLPETGFDIFVEAILIVTGLTMIAEGS